MKRRTILYMAAVLMALLAVGCGAGSGTEEPETGIEGIVETGEEPGVGETAGEDSVGGGLAGGAGVDGSSVGAGADADGSGGSDIGGEEPLTPEEAALQERFGENCIPSQTFPIELDGCEGDLWFVAYAPSAENREFYAQVLRDGELLAALELYRPTEAAGLSFTSLDAVSFWDINFDGFTDILMIETYGDTQFAVVYYGDSYESYDGNVFWSFYCMKELSDCLTAQAEPLTVPGVKTLLSGGKRNGAFDGYAKAYEAVIRLSELEQGEEIDESFLYDLIYVDEDEIPELVTGLKGYYVNLYTYQNGTVYTLMDEWGYGVMGNAGYEYVQGKNRLRNYNADGGGAIMHTYYMRINAQHEIETPVWLETYNFDDTNGNGIMDEGEDNEKAEGAVYLNGEKASEEELTDIYAVYEEEAYRYIMGEKTAEEVRQALQQ